MKETAEIRAELQAAHDARGQGNEGMARVCARRAAGWAIQRRYHEHLAETANAYLLLQWLEQQEAVEEPLRAAAGRLTTRITEDHDLPHSEDPLRDAHLLVAAMIGDTTE